LTIAREVHPPASARDDEKSKAPSPAPAAVLPPMAPPPHRDALLAKLRARAKAAGYR
jgi:hypothetical protein